VKIHIVKQGDSLYSIAKKYDVPLDDVVKANPDISNPDAIQVGMKVKIPARPKSPLGVIHQHIVQQGDTLWKLSKAWGIQLTDLIKANPQLKNPNALLTGEVVNIPQTGHAGGAGDSGTGAMHGKANTGVQAASGAKANTAIIPAAGAKANTAVTPEQPPVVITPVETPVPQPAPAPAPAPAPVQVTPIAETKPIYGFEVHEHVEIVHQYPVQEVAEHTGYGAQPGYVMPQAGYGMPYPGTGGQAAQGYGQAMGGYGHEMPMAVEEASWGGGYGQVGPVQGGYGMPYPMAEAAMQPGYGPEYGHQGYGPGYPMAQPYVGGEQAHAGYGIPASIPPLGGEIGGLYGFQDYSYSPPDAQDAVPGLAMPAANTPGCKSCGGSAAHLPSNLYAAAPYAEGYPGTGYAGERNSYGFVPYGQGPMVSPASTGGGYGQGPMVSPASMGGGYGQGPMVSPASIGGGYGQGPMVSPASTGGGYGQGPMVSPASMGGGYGQGPMVSPASMGGGYGQGPMVSPASMGGGYGQGPMVSPASMGGGYGQGPMVSPASMGGYPGMVAGAQFGSPMGELPVGYSAPGVAGAGVGAVPGYCDPQYAGYGGFPPIPPMPPMPGIPPMPPLREPDDGLRTGTPEDEEEAATIQSAIAKKRQAKPKAKRNPARAAKPKRKESLPWIKW